jgi:hypothetical protein
MKRVRQPKPPLGVRAIRLSKFFLAQVVIQREAEDVNHDLVEAYLELYIVCDTYTKLLGKDVINEKGMKYINKDMKIMETNFKEDMLAHKRTLTLMNKMYVYRNCSLTGERNNTNQEGK